ncbi:uncharacterized protein T551_02471 [Pneumocystis jirovecii RU7]|uniref:Uncharacterized protein n=1 Tax=Pneumocystis jirovecii (strain RU7) TaxID=1408657 RepID=A0A0W4ZJS4_PNEJ7|nr:uncharacterized protein T551_02471 [Pneumocystis jirovecii RU7]KTW28621.1 hypothetical protein T551_02471 [Pneumocystis jirovecii RU7]
MKKAVLAHSGPLNYARAVAHTEPQPVQQTGQAPVLIQPIRASDPVAKTKAEIGPETEARTGCIGVAGAAGAAMSAAGAGTGSTGGSVGNNTSAAPIGASLGVMRGRRAQRSSSSPNRAYKTRSHHSVHRVGAPGAILAGGAGGMPGIEVPAVSAVPVVPAVPTGPAVQQPVQTGASVPLACATNEHVGTPPQSVQTGQAAGSEYTVGGTGISSHHRRNSSIHSSRSSLSPCHQNQTVYPPYAYHTSPYFFGNY